MGHFLGAAESAACVTEQQLELNSGNVAGAAGKGRYVGVPTVHYTMIDVYLPVGSMILKIDGCCKMSLFTVN
jgi:hypothetical protein